MSDIDLIVVDEAQRMHLDQLEWLIAQVESKSKNCIFSYDIKQTLTNTEISANASALINMHSTVPSFKLTDKIRTNKEVARFIKCLFNLNEDIHDLDYTNVELKYFDDHKTAKPYLEYLRSEEWRVVNYTPDKHKNLPYELNNLEGTSDNAHTVIGQEFDNVVAVVDGFFCYNDEGLLTTRYNQRPYYLPSRMLFQIVSRTRIKLGVVIIGNVEILKRCLDILMKKGKGEMV